MNWKAASLIALAALLAGIYVRYFTDWFRPQPIQIFPQVRPVAGRPGAVPVAFILDHKRQLTSVKVYSVPALRTNKLAPPLWSLSTDSNSVPTKGIFYGVAIDGMRTQLEPQPLLPGVPYRLTLESDGRIGTADFQTYERVQPKPAAVAPPPSPFK